MKTTKRRLLSLFMAMVMVFSLLPTALAEGEGEQPPHPPHVWGEWKTTKEATCTEAGSKERSCTVTGCTEKETEELPMTEHAWEETPDGTIPATCEEDGTQVYKCKNCNATKDETIKALGHDLQKKVVKAATCGDDGVIEVTCSRCDYEDYETTPATGKHTLPAVSAITHTDKDHTYTCTVCNQSVTEDHKFGTDKVTCTICGYVKVQETTLKLNRTTLNLSVGDTATLSATITPDAPLTWENTYDTIASITRSPMGSPLLLRPCELEPLLSRFLAVVSQPLAELLSAAIWKSPLPKQL